MGPDLRIWTACIDTCWEIRHPWAIRFATCTTLRTSPAETMAFVRHHVAIGVSRMWLFFDDPDDAALEAVRDVEQVTAIRCDDEHWEGRGGRPDVVSRRQGYNTRRAMKLAARESIDWLFHVDSDEFVYTESEPLSAILDDAEWEVLVLPPLEVLPVLDSRDLVGPRHFKVPHLGQVVPHAQVPGVGGVGHTGRAIRQKLEAFESIFGADRADLFRFRGHPLGKSGARVSVGRYRGFGPHTPRPRGEVELDRRAAPGHWVLHYDGHDYASWRAKWMGRATGVSNHGRVKRRRQRQLEEFRQVVVSSGEAALHDYFLEAFLPTDAEVALAEELDLVRRIEQPVSATGETSRCSS